MFVSNLLVRSLKAERFHPLSDQLWMRDRRAAFGPGLHGREVDELVARLVLSSGKQGLGLALGEHGSMSMFHVVSHLMLSCQTLRGAFGALQEYGQLLLGGLDFQLEEQDGEATFGFDPPDAADLTARFWADLVLTFALRVSWVHVGSGRGRPRVLSLAHGRPDYADEYLRVFGSPVLFEQPRYGLTFSANLLDITQPHADAILEAALRVAARRQRLSLLEDHALLEGLRHALREEVDLTEVDFERLARRLGTTKQHLRKRLASLGHSCGDLLNEARCQRALSDLREDQHIDVIAERLGFSKRSSFHRAFKRWTGKTPNQYRGKRGPSRSPRLDSSQVASNEHLSSGEAHPTASASELGARQAHTARSLR